MCARTTNVDVQIVAYVVLWLSSIVTPMNWLSDPAAWSALAALLALEIVLGVDNVIFISILASKLPPDQQDRARRTGLLAAAGMRLLLL